MQEQHITQQPHVHHSPMGVWPLPGGVQPVTANDQVSRMMEISAFWLGIGAKPPVVCLDTLVPEVVLHALASGKACHYGDWTIRCTPPKSVFSLMGDEQVVSSIWVASIHGFTTFTPVSLSTVEAACRYIEHKDAVVAARAREEQAMDRLH